MDSDKLIYRIAEKGLTFLDVADMIDIDHLYREVLEEAATRFFKKMYVRKRKNKDI